MDVEIVGNTPQERERTLTEREAAAVLNVTDRQVRRLVVSGVLKRAGAGHVTLASVETRLGRPVDANPETAHAEMAWVPVVALEALMKRADRGDGLLLEHKATAEQLAALESERDSFAKRADDLAADLETERTRAAEREAEQAAALDAERTKAEETAANLAAERTKVAEIAAEREQVVARANEVIEREQAKAAQLAAQLEAERSKGFWARLFNKGGV